MNLIFEFWKRKNGRTYRVRYVLCGIFACNFSPVVTRFLSLQLAIELSLSNWLNLNRELNHYATPYFTDSLLLRVIELEWECDGTEGRWCSNIVIICDKISVIAPNIWQNKGVSETSWIVDEDWQIGQLSLTDCFRVSFGHWKLISEDTQ